MIMHSSPFEIEKHYDIACEWWKQWKWNALPLAALPKNGIVVYDNELPVCMGFIYLTDSCICWVEHIIANQSADRTQRSHGIDLLIKALSKKAKSLDYVIAMTSINKKTLIAKHIKNGYAITDTSMTNLLKVL